MPLRPQAAEYAEARDLWGLATEIYAAAREIADFDLFHLMVYHAGEDRPMHFVLFGNREKTWPGERQPIHYPPPDPDGEPVPLGEARPNTNPQTLTAPGDALALKLRRTVDQNSLPLPYGDAFNPFPSQLYVPILLRFTSGIEYRVSTPQEYRVSNGELPPFEDIEPIGVLCVLSGAYDFFTPSHRQAYESLARESAPLIAHCLRPDYIGPSVF